jgi:parallel beta-helix repeat protein
MDTMASHSRQAFRALLSIFGLVGVIALVGGCLVVGSANACDKVAAPNGSDAAAGTETKPFKSAQRLVSALSAGQVGCLRAGVYNESVEFTRAGTPSARIVLKSFPDERARIVGEMAVRANAHYVTVSNLDLDGTNPGRWPGPAISANHVVFEDNDVTNRNMAVCFLIGTGSGRPQGTILRRNRIHNCGQLPATNLHEGIYVSNADGTQILDNVIYDVADMGIQLYPDAQGSVIRGNIIDGNGEGIIFSGDHGLTANNNLVEGNVITNSRIRFNVESYYEPGTPIGYGNVVRKNCIFGGARDSGNGGVSAVVGFSISESVIADPQYVDRAAKDFRLRESSPCRNLLTGAAPTLPPADPSPADPPPVDPQPVDPAPVDPPPVDPRPAPVPDLPPTTTPSPTSPAPGKGGRVTLRLHKRKIAPGRRVAARGRVVARGVTGKVAIQRRDRGGWRTIARAAITKGRRFDALVRVPAAGGGGVVSLRAVVRNVGESRTAQLLLRKS